MGKKPKVSWAQFLEAAPYFMELLWAEEDPLGPEWAPLVRAVAFADVFFSQVENGGVAQYLFNKASKLPHFSEAPEIVRQNSLLGNVAELMHKVHQYPAVHPELHASAMNFLRTGKVDYEEDYRAYTREFDFKVGAACERAIIDIQHDIVLRPQAYFDLWPVVQNGTVEIPCESGAWRVRFVNGFPIGPNIQPDEFGGRLFRFSSNRCYLEFDSIRVNAKPDVDRNYVDLVNGVRTTTSFSNGRVDRVHSKIHSRDHGLSERYGEDGQPKYSGVGLNGMRIEMHRRDLEGSPFTTWLPLPSGATSIRRYFANGQLNTERVQHGTSSSYSQCFDESGMDLAPGGTGVFRELWSYDERGPRWRVGKMVNGHLHGQLKYLEADGSVWSTEEWNDGKLITHRN